MLDERIFDFTGLKIPNQIGKSVMYQIKRVLSQEIKMYSPLAERTFVILISLPF